MRRTAPADGTDDAVSFTTVPYRCERRSELFRLMGEVWGTYITVEEFEWWFERNPAGPPLIRLAERSNQLVGVACMSPYRLLVDGQEMVVPVPLHVATHPSYRRLGVFTRLEGDNEEAAKALAPIAITFPNDASRRVFVDRLGWRLLARPRLWARPALGRPPSGVREVDGFGTEADELWQQLAPPVGASVIRDARYLNWRFAFSPRDYSCLLAEGGIAVVGRKRIRGRRVAYLAELLARDGRTTRQLLRAAVAVARAPVLLALAPTDVVAAGFAPTPKRVAVLGKELRPGGHLPTRWRFSLADGDAW